MVQVFFYIIYGPSQPFVQNPVLAFVMAGCLALLLAASLLRARHLRPVPHLALTGVAALWILFGMHEIQAQQAGWNIRVDLMLIWPPLMLATIAAVAGAVGTGRKLAS